MGLTAPYKQHNYLGEYANDAAALTFIQAVKWDSVGDGSGNPRSGMTYFDTTYSKMKVYNGTAWETAAGSSVLDWQNSVLDIFDPTSALPADPENGDRYIASATANGWTATRIYQYDSAGSQWVETIPNEGFATRVEDENKVYIFDGSTWGLLEATLAHNSLSGIQGGSSGEYYHLTSAQHTDLTTNHSTLHDSRYYTETEISSTTAGSEGAALVGTDTKANLNNATTVEVALTDLNSKNPPKRSSGDGNPNGTVAGAVGDIYVDATNDIPYINVTGANTGWVVM